MPAVKIVLAHNFRLSRLIWLILFLLLIGCRADAPVATEAPATAAAVVVKTATLAATQTPVATATETATPLAATATATAFPVGSPTALPTTAATETPPGIAVRIVTPAVSADRSGYQVLGFSTLGYAIEAFQFGDGPNEIVFVGGHHGGYEWNTILLAYEMADYFTAYASELPESVTLTIIPSANPDGQVAVVGATGRFTPDDVATNTVIGRFNANNVDLNRNWDCEWSGVGRWGPNFVSGGTAPFSEVENRVLLDYFQTANPALVVWWHSRAPGVFLGSCGGPPLADTTRFANLYANASGYPLEETFDAYPITGDASNYLNLIGIPSFVVELETRFLTESGVNLAGMLAILEQLP